MWLDLIVFSSVYPSKHLPEKALMQILVKFKKSSQVHSYTFLKASLDDFRLKTRPACGVLDVVASLVAFFRLWL
jgi:hypothetical protein